MLLATENRVEERGTVANADMPIDESRLEVATLVDLVGKSLAQLSWHTILTDTSNELDVLVSRVDSSVGIPRVEDRLDDDDSVCPSRESVGSGSKDVERDEAVADTRAADKREEAERQ
jgi:hypothetical protein